MPQLYSISIARIATVYCLLFVPSSKLQGIAAQLKTKYTVTVHCYPFLLHMSKIANVSQKSVSLHFKDLIPPEMKTLRKT